VTDGKEFQIRGYMILNAASYLRGTLGEQDAQRVFRQMSPSTLQVIETASSAGWYPIAALSEIFDNVAAIGKGDDERAKEALIACGAFIAKEATNTFLKLLMRMLTPNLFAKKLPDFWRRDCTHGRLEVEVTEQMLVCRYFDLPGFNHVVCCGAGFARFALEAMGKSIESATVHDWSLATPNADGARLELVWRK
jgi:hypothetical protein